MTTMYALRKVLSLSDQVLISDEKHLESTGRKTASCFVVWSVSMTNSELLCGFIYLFLEHANRLMKCVCASAFLRYLMGL